MDEIIAYHPDRNNQKRTFTRSQWEQMPDDKYGWKMSTTPPAPPANPAPEPPAPKTRKPRK